MVDSFDQSEKAGKVLDYVLEDERTDASSTENNEALVAEELRRQQLIKRESQRIRSRVLFVSNDPTLLVKDSPAQQARREFTDVFDEIHIFVLHESVPKRAERQRIAERVWVYPVYGRSMTQLLWRSYRKAKTELIFGDSFRPDIIVGEDAFEAGIAGYFLAWKFGRPYQLHILENIFTEHFQANDKRKDWHLRFRRFLFKRVESVRVATMLIKKIIGERYPKIEDIAVLPQFYNINEILQNTAVGERQKRYPQFAFTFLFIGELNSESTLFRTIDALRFLLRTPSIGLVVVGDGPARAGFEERAAILGVQKQVIFKPKVEDLMTEMQGVDMFICTDTDMESDKHVIQAAAAGLPILMARNALRDDIFVDGESGFLCDPADTLEFTQKATKFLNANALRNQFAINARDVVHNRIEESPEMYHLAYRDTIETVLIAHAETIADDQPEAQPQSEAEEGGAAAVPAAPKPPKKRFSLFSEDSNTNEEKSPEATTKTTKVNGVEMVLPGE